MAGSQCNFIASIQQNASLNVNTREDKVKNPGNKTGRSLYLQSPRKAVQSSTSNTESL